MKPAVIFLGLVLLAIVGAIVTRPLFERAKPDASLASTRDVLNAANQGGSARQQREFPNTPQGRMTKLMYEFIQESDRQQVTLEDGMKEIGWEWVMTPES